MKNKDFFERLEPEDLKKIKKSPQPLFIHPMLATLTEDYFSSAQWIYEHKFDGVRCIAVKKNGIVRLMSRNERLMNDEYPELVHALQAQQADNFIIDGEIVALDAHGVSDFQLLQSRINLHDLARIHLHENVTPVYYHIFDALYLHGHDITALGLLVRKELLKKILIYNNLLIYTDYRSPDGLIYFKQACKNRWEGLIAKQIHSSYQQARSSAWLKFKCSLGQELIIVGYTDPGGSRTDFGALLVGYYHNDKLIFAGKVGSGFSRDTLAVLGKKLRARIVQKCPVENYDGPVRGVHWVRPDLVADFKFAQWTKGNKLRVPRYKGLRKDKSARLVVKEDRSRKI